MKTNFLRGNFVRSIKMYTFGEGGYAVEKINVLVLAGDSGKREFGDGVTNKSLMDVYGKWMVEYVVDALRDSEMVGKIAIIGPAETLKTRLEGRVDYFVQEETHLFENLKKGLSSFRDEEFVLVATSDIPMIDGHIVSDFIEKCRVYNADLCYPIVNKTVNDAVYPGLKRTYVKLRDGIFTGGNIIGLNPKVVGSCAEFAKGFIAHRKNPWKLGRLLGFRFLLLLIVGRLSISRIEERFSELLKIKARAIISPYPEIANDIDDPNEIGLAKQYLKEAKGKF